MASWYTADANCKKKGGTLAAIDDKRQEWRVATGTDQRRVKLWIGLNGNKKKAHKWRWTSGKKVRYVHFRKDSYFSVFNNKTCVLMDKFRRLSKWKTETC